MESEDLHIKEQGGTGGGRRAGQETDRRRPAGRPAAGSLLGLFKSFFKFGCFTFGGGWSIIAQMQRIMSGVRPACIAMVIGTCIKLLPSNYAPAGAADLRLVILGLIDLGLLLKLKLSIPKVIVLNAAVGLLFLR